MIVGYDPIGIFEDAAAALREHVVPLGLMRIVSRKSIVRDFEKLHLYAAPGDAFLFEPPGMTPEGFDMSETSGYVGTDLRGVLAGVMKYGTSATPEDAFHDLKRAVWDAWLIDPSRGNRCFDTLPRGFGHSSTLHEDLLVYAIHFACPMEWAHEA